MDILNSFWSHGVSTLQYAIPFLFVLTVVVFFHELGHFLVARLFGVKVEAFSIGFGPELIGWNDRYGTRWKVAAIPLGGFVKFLGDENASSKPEDAAKIASYDEQTRSQLFQLKPVWQRACVVAAGPIANFLLSTVIFAMLFTFVGRSVIDPRVGEIMAGSPAQIAGFQSGDKILSIDGEKIETFSQIQRYVATSNGRSLKFAVERAGKETELNVAARQDTINQRIGGAQKIWRLGISSGINTEEVVYEKHNIFTSLVLGAKETYFLIERNLSFIGDLFMGRAPLDELGGPIRIAEVSGQAADISFTALVSLTAVLSVSIGLLNLFPIPMLDGGHLVFYALEALRRKPLSERTQDWGFRIGMFLVLSLMVLATWNDIARLIAS